jgi:hypothetical protein
LEVNFITAFYFSFMQVAVKSQACKMRHRTLFVWEEKGEAAKFEGDFAYIRVGRHDVIERLPQESGATAATTTTATGRAHGIIEREPGHGAIRPGRNAYMADHQCHRRQR